LKRLLAPLGLAAALALVAPTGSLGIIGTDYEGDVGGDLATLIAFNVVKKDSGKKVKGVLLDGLPYECEADPSGSTEGIKVIGSFKVENREFAGKREAVENPILDPTAKVTGKLKRDGTAQGTIRVRGELADAGSDCSTGTLDWAAEKTGFGRIR
jgi:hypothetical protein